MTQHFRLVPPGCFQQDTDVFQLRGRAACSGSSGSRAVIVALWSSLRGDNERSSRS